MVADTTADEGISEVREHIEKVVETLVGDNLDQTSVLKLVNHSSCKIQWFHAWHYKFFDLKTCFADDRIFILFHRNLSDALTQLAQAIYAVLSRNDFFYTLFEIFIFCPKIQHWFPEKNCQIV